MSVEALTAAFLQKKLQKEIPASGNEPALQAKVDESKTLEWETLLGKECHQGLDWRKSKIYQKE